ncbi:serine/threonine-protein kinase [Pontiella sulfatireligans]|uniref:Serine/threonine-protein kinase PknD n=1 Tax=Pontiella sulfatireligans TaxID=2750658 RepID=A0A6C2UL35_9BACT|nr:serine/threonine-protein kinase [Pontiella sulfatireligans]VGO20679.1 Serine/threonine-protein kinase PknD [Pontiella sulfatireligans]
MKKTPEQDRFAGDSAEERLETLYFMAEKYDEMGEKEINPSLHSLSQVTQRYQSAELIAEGGMKRIFKVYDARAKRPLAMAMLRDDAPEDLRDPFIHEAWLTALLDHPNIMTIHDVGVKTPGQPYFTMDLKQGDSLRELIEKLHAGDRKMQARYPLEALLQIFIKVCDAVSYAHSLHVLHLDLKPANVQIGEYGQVLVCDWGLGRVLGGDDLQELDRMLFNPDLLGSTNLFGQIKGTLGYMAPEQLAEDMELDARTDIYGLGCILYSLLTLLRPLTGDDEEILKRTKDGAIVSPTERTPEREIPKSLSAVVMKALATNPAQRYGSVDALRTEVHRYLTGFATQAENARVLKQLSLFYRRNRRFCLTLFGSVLVIVAGAVGSFWKVSEARRAAENTLALYEAGQSDLEKMSFKNAESIAALAERYQFHGDQKRAEAILLAALENDPANEFLLRELGVHYFILQQFNAALPYIERGMHRKDDVCETTRIYAGIKVDDEKLSAPQVVDILQRVHIHEPLMLSILLQDQRQRFDLEERAEILEVYLQLINPDWTDGWFEYDAVASRLRMGGKGLWRVSTQKSVLIGLNPRTLDLSGSEVEELWKEIDTAVETLDIRGTPMTKLWPLKRFVHLTQLIISPGQLSEEQLNPLPARVKVVEKNLD